MKRSLLSRILTIFLVVLLMFTNVSISVHAETTDDPFEEEEEEELTPEMLRALGSISMLSDTDVEYDTSKDAAGLVGSLLGSGISATNCNTYGDVKYFTGGSDAVGIDKGVILSTNSGGDNDSDLATLIAAEGKEYGGHTSLLKFSMTATGTLLNFNYVFASREFNQGSTYNDIFGLFVSVNNGPYENIAKLDNGRYITITNLRAGQDGTKLSNGTSTSIVTGTVYDYFTAKNVSLGETCNGVSNLFNAQKTVNVGDTVDIKFVIADVGDKSFNSYVMIEAGSLSFDPPGTKVDYESEKLTDFDPGSTYTIQIKDENGTPAGDVYTFDIGEDGSIPVRGTDKNGKTYDFIGKKLSIIKKGSGETADSEPQDLTVSTRQDTPGAPEETVTVPTQIETSEILTSTDTIVIYGTDGQEYSIDGVTWTKPNTDGYVIYTGLTPNSTHTVYNRMAATSTSFASEKSAGTPVTLKTVDVYLEDITDGNEYCSVTLMPDRWTSAVVYNGKTITPNASGNYVIVGDNSAHILKVTDRAGNVTEVSITIPGHVYRNYTEDFDLGGTSLGTKTASCEHGCGSTHTVALSAEDSKATVNGYLTTGIVEKPGAPETTIGNLSPDVAEGMLTTSEKSAITSGATLKVYLEITDETNTIAAADKEAMETYAESETDLAGYTIGAYVDLSLYKQINSNTPSQISDSGEPLLIVITVPEALRNLAGNNPAFKVLRNHQGTVTVLDTTYDPVTHQISFYTQLFSDYAIAYQPGAGGNGGGGNSNIVTAGETDGNEDTNTADSAKKTGKKDAEPKTGDVAMPYATVGMTAGMLYLADLFRVSDLGLDEEDKKRIVERIVLKVKRKNKVFKALGIVAIFLILVFYHSIGKKVNGTSEEK